MADLRARMGSGAGEPERIWPVAVTHYWLVSLTHGPVREGLFRRTSANRIRLLWMMFGVSSSTVISSNVGRALAMALEALHESPCSFTRRRWKGKALRRFLRRKKKGEAVEVGCSSHDAELHPHCRARKNQDSFAASTVARQSKSNNEHDCTRAT